MRDLITIKSVKIMKLKSHCFVISDCGEYKINNDLIYKFKIERNRQFTEDEFDEILAENDLMQAKKNAYDYIAYSPRSQKKVIAKLLSKGYSNQTINKVLDFLYEFDLLDDELYAEKYIKDFLLKKSAGRDKLIQKLIENGIETELAKNIVYNNISDDMEIEMIRTALNSNDNLMNSPKSKIYRFFLNRGFNIYNIKKNIEN